MAAPARRAGGAGVRGPMPAPRAARATGGGGLAGSSAVSSPSSPPAASSPSTSWYRSSSAAPRLVRLARSGIRAADPAARRGDSSRSWSRDREGSGRARGPARRRRPTAVGISTAGPAARPRPARTSRTGTRRSSGAGCRYDLRNASPIGGAKWTQADQRERRIEDQGDAVGRSGAAVEAEIPGRDAVAVGAFAARARARRASARRRPGARRARSASGMAGSLAGRRSGRRQRAGGRRPGAQGRCRAGDRLGLDRRGRGRSGARHGGRMPRRAASRSSGRPARRLGPRALRRAVGLLGFDRARLSAGLDRRAVLDDARLEVGRLHVAGDLHVAPDPRRRAG